MAQGLDSIQCALSEDQQRKLIVFVEVLHKWNKTYNLTAIRKRKDLISRHLLDSLVTLPYIKGASVLDVGSGAGLPGLPLAIALPETKFVLLDSSSKKTRFMIQATGELGLSNVKIVHSRVQDYVPDSPFDTVITRAFADTEKFLNLAGQHCAKNGQFLLMQGEAASENLPEGFEKKEKIKLDVPEQTGARYLTIIQPVHH
ncbi:MAG: 16S rRNA (guanine(527)-N(7))-methyltransferase RsmG [Gammaproteobacteria bacterium]|nr:16S rRNA (guanine(527)-N(7))-methyltransferase RsmG [Gammaproteobacteria bacterium]